MAVGAAVPEKCPSLGPSPGWRMGWLRRYLPTVFNSMEGCVMFRAHAALIGMTAAIAVAALGVPFAPQAPLAALFAPAMAEDNVVTESADTAGDVATGAADTAGDVATSAADTAGDVAVGAADTAGTIAEKAVDIASDVATSTVEFVGRVIDSIF